MNRHPCPFCTSRRSQVLLDECQVECRDCGAHGPVAKTHDEAVELWNKRPSGNGNGDAKH